MKRGRIIGKYCTGFFFTLGTVLSSIGLLLLFKFPPIYDYIIHSALDLRPESEAYKAWSTNDPPLILDIYFFNWTNAKDVYNSSVRPNFQQVGPYRFKEVKEKYNIVFHDNDTVSYQFVKRYYFMEEESPRPLSDVINTVNAVATSTAYKLRFMNSLKKFMVDLSMSTTAEVYVTKTISELLFEGYDDKLLNLARMLAPMFTDAGEIQDKFGWFYKRNNTYGISGDFSMYTGHDENFGKMLSWDYKNRTDFYEGKCGEIHGSAGEFHPINRGRDSIEVYSSEMCTYAPLEYDEDVVVKGVRGYKFAADTLFDNGSRVADNACYCNGECIPSGVLNISSCRMNAPIFLSLPHFYNADPYYTRDIDGVYPSKEAHDFYITLEPKSAIVMDIGARMQLNVLLQPIDGFSIFTKVPKIFVPIFFFDQVVTMNDDLAVQMKLLQDLPEISETASYILVVIGALFITLTLILSLRSPKDKLKKTEYKITTTSVTQDDIPLQNKSENT